MKSTIAVMISIIIIIAFSGNTANSQPNKELLGGGSQFVNINKTEIEAETTESIIEDSGRKLTKRSPGGDGGLGSTGWWMLGFNRLDDSKIDVVTESSQGNTKRLTKRSPGGDGGLGSTGWWMLGFNRLDDSKIDVVTESSQGNTKRLRRSAPEEDGVQGSIERFVRDSNPRNDVDASMATKAPQGVLNINRNSNEFSTSKGSPTTEVIPSDEISTSTKKNLSWKRNKGREYNSNICLFYDLPEIACWALFNKDY
ncbi:uncharacterized protein LOC111029820 [Myzus persicae]|uniref:uncharacterized protein LOC111029820 n=1 Tax=Myzus persicae TaxID=13164 RepID=UPI000B9317C5|nr:uncharacterized protein LOC111029820 [Myzus persicae]